MIANAPELLAFHRAAVALIQQFYRTKEEEDAYKPCSRRSKGSALAIANKTVTGDATRVPQTTVLGDQNGILSGHTIAPHRPRLRLRNNRLVWAGVEHDIVVTGKFIAELALWMPYLATVMWMRVIKSQNQSVPLSLYFSPTKPGPWYMIIGAAAWGGIRIETKARPEAQAVYFDDVTRASSANLPQDAINGACTDITKSYVAAVFETVFGYPLAVDPARHIGPMVRKSETNGTHGGGIVTGPAFPILGSVYQKLVDTADENQLCTDLRTPCIGGRPVFVWRKRKQADRRFAIQNDSATLHKVGDIFSAAEIDLIVAFNAVMGLECGGLDILRDRDDGRIYIVDVNKTDVGPLIALTWSVKMKSMRLLGQALRTWLLSRQAVLRAKMTLPNAPS